MKMQQELSFQAQIYTDLDGMPARMRFPDKTNRGKMLSTLMMWKRVIELATKKYETLLKQLIDEDLIKDPKTINTPGTFVIGEANKVSLSVSVSQPRKAFNFEWFANKLQVEYKVPVAMTRALYEEAKQPGETQNRTLSFKES